MGQEAKLISLKRQGFSSESTAQTLDAASFQLPGPTHSGCWAPTAGLLFFLHKRQFHSPPPLFYSEPGLGTDVGRDFPRLQRAPSNHPDSATNDFLRERQQRSSPAGRAVLGTRLLRRKSFASDIVTAALVSVFHQTARFLLASIVP